MTFTALAARIGLGVELAQVDARRWLPADFAVFRHYIGEYAATYVKLGRQAHKFCCCGSDQVIQNAIGHGFMEAAFVTERPHIKLEAFELHAFLIGNVIQIKHGKIRLAGLGAQTSELGDFHVDMKITFRLGVIEGFEGFAGLTGHEGYRINRINKASIIQSHLHYKTNKQDPHNCA